MATQPVNSPSSQPQLPDSSDAKEHPSDLQPQPLNSSRPPTPPPSEPDSLPLLDPKTEFFLDWALKVLGVASAILFGIWAPISYQATKSGNSDNDASQSALSSSLSALSTQGRTVMTLQASAATALASLQRKVDSLGILRVWEFCDGRASSLEACVEVTRSVDIERLVTSLASLTSLGSPTARPTSTSNQGETTIPTSGPKGSARSGVNVSLAAGLGILFGALALLGAMGGLLAWKARVKRGKRREAMMGPGLS